MTLMLVLLIHASLICVVPLFIVFWHHHHKAQPT